MINDGLLQVGDLVILGHLEDGNAWCGFKILVIEHCKVEFLTIGKR